MSVVNYQFMKQRVSVRLIYYRSLACKVLLHKLNNRSTVTKSFSKFAWVRKRKWKNAVRGTKCCNLIWSIWLKSNFKSKFSFNYPRCYWKTFFKINLFKNLTCNIFLGKRFRVLSTPYVFNSTQKCML